MQEFPARDFWQAGQSFAFDEPLAPGDPRFVDTADARGHFTFNRLLRKLGVDQQEMALKQRPDSLYALFCGHRGCGKSTELVRLSQMLRRPDLYYVIFVDVSRELDPHSLQYSEILAALAAALMRRLEVDDVVVDHIFLSQIENWFTQRIECNEATKQFALEAKAGLEIQSGIPFLGRMFGAITNSFKVNSTYKEELRKVVTNSFAQFADAFNQLIVAADEAVARAGRGRKILFVIDGTDRMNSKQARELFVEDAYQLQQIRSLFIYCAPIHLLADENQVQQLFASYVLPMIKTATDPSGKQKVKEGYDALRAMVFGRVGEDLFDSVETVDYLIEHSGGNPRELLRLLNYTYQEAESELFDRAAAEAAVRALATDYRRFLQTDDYKILYQMDQGSAQEENSERILFLLYNLALLEYNGFWRASHPVIRTLDAYRRQAHA